MVELPPWSYTMLQDLSNCLWKGYRKYVAKDLPKEQKSPEQELGIKVHQAFETAINKRNVSSLPEAYRHLAEPMIARAARAEVKMAVNELGDPVGYWDRPWGRGATDVQIIEPPVAILFDWKTGKVKEDPRELMAHSYLLQRSMPGVRKVYGAYVWLVEDRLGETHDLTNTDRWLAGTGATLAKAQEALDSGVWPKSPNPLCGYCPVKDCEHNRS